MIGGGLLAMLAAYFVHGGDAAVARGAPSSLLPHLVGVLRDALVIALAANALNLLDVRPGRALFGFALLALPTFAIVALTGSVSGGALLGAVALAVAIEAWPDASGRAMMGDTGSNLLGAVAGLAAVIELPVWGRVVLLVLLAALNITAERVSLSQIIEKTPWLRALDRSLGVR
jgi:UDP-N-acetylmuramyl pentapeptide phosphotransferase/UDP-N-acetylglucosamine-1-phosphate transferase